MKILSFDPATKTGWSLLDDDKLIDYGIINCSAESDICKKLYYISQEVQIILNKTKPDIIACEDLVLAMSGVKILVFLSRINGCILNECYKFLKKSIIIINISCWKKNCGLELKGNAQKWQTLLAVVKKFNFINEDQLKNFNNLITEEVNLQYELKDKIKFKKQELDKLRKKGKKEKIDTAIEEKNLKRIIDNRKKTLKNIEKDSKKVFGKMGKEITAITGISEDIADSIGIALAVSRLQ